METYLHYCRWCRSLGIKPACRQVYENEKRIINDAPSGFSRYGVDYLMTAGRKLQRAYVLKIADALGIADEPAMLRVLGLIDADGNVTAEGKKVSRMRAVEGQTFRLWAVDRVAAMLGKYQEQPEEPEPQPDALVVDVLRTTSAMRLEAA